MKDPIHMSIISFPPFDGEMTKCCSASTLNSSNIEWTDKGLEVETAEDPICWVCKKVNPEMIPYENKSEAKTD
jgi:hypothetical protein